MPPCINFGLIIAFSALISPTVLRSVMLAQSLHPSAPRDQLPLEFGVVAHRRRSMLDAKPDQAIKGLDQIARPQKAAIPPQEVPHIILIQAARSEKLAGNIGNSEQRGDFSATPTVPCPSTRTAPVRSTATADRRNEVAPKTSNSDFAASSEIGVWKLRHHDFPC